MPTVVLAGSRTRQRAGLLLIALAACVVGVVILRRFEPGEGSFFPQCLLFRWTGLHCPGCGATRALHALVHGRPWDAVRNNPLLIVGLPLILVGVASQRRRQRAGLPTSARFAQAVAVIVIVYFIARNVPSPQRSWLAPPAVQSQPDLDRVR